MDKKWDTDIDMEHPNHVSAEMQKQPYFGRNSLILAEIVIFWPKLAGF